MANLNELFGTNKEFENEGVWVNYGDDIEFRIARIGNPSFKRYYKQLLAPYGGPDRIDVISDNKADKIVTKVIAKTVLLDWKNVQVDGEDVPYTVESAEQFLLQYPDLLSFVTDVASKQETYKEVRDKELMGN